MSVTSVSASAKHDFSKLTLDSIRLVEGLGVDGDCHSGPVVQHLSRMRIVPPPPNLRQVHLIPLEVLQERDLAPGAIGENITTYGVDLLNLSAGTRLKFHTADGASDPVIVLTGLRNPCPQIDQYRSGLKETFLVRDDQRNIVGRQAGVMAIVEVGGSISRGAKITVEQPTRFEPLKPV